MPTRCVCHLTDCSYWSAVPGEKPPACDCLHNEKQFYMRQPCPLYRKNWEQKEGAASELRDKLLRKRRP